MGNIYELDSVTMYLCPMQHYRDGKKGNRVLRQIF